MVSDMMTVEQLKGSILQLAMLGKLVEQRPEEGTGEELYKKIQAEKKRLIREGKVKKKLLLDNEKDDIPFDIPDSWRWVRISEISSVINGDRGKNYPSKSTLSHEGIPFISALNLDGRTVVKDDSLLCVSQEQYDRLGSGKLEKGDIVVCIRGSLGKHGRYPFEKGAIASSLVICRQFIKSESMALFIMSFLDAPLFFDQIRQYDNGTAQPNLAAKSLEQFFIPLPPLAEQKRIVAKIEELMPFVEQYATVSTKLNTLNATFPEMMKKSILQEAVQGKLVPQDPNDEPASVLLGKIAEEKKRLIKEGKIKKQKSLPEITEDDIPFDIPESWEWVRLNNCLDVRDGTHDSPKYYSDGYPLVTSKNLKDGKIDFSTCKLISDEDFHLINQRSRVDDNDILFAMIGTVGNPVLFRGIADFSIKNMALFKHIGDYLNMEYVFWFLCYAQHNMKRQASGGVQSFVSLNYLRNYLIPLPPFEEQRRIVEVVKEEMLLIDKMNKER